MASKSHEVLPNDGNATKNASRGLIATLHPPVIRDSSGNIIWNNNDYSFLDVTCPETVDPKLWRQGQLTNIHGLFEVTAGIYQVRGYDISNMTIIEGKTGVIVMDPLISSECARAAYNLYSKHRGGRPVKAVIYSHSHIDHYGGALGVLPESSTGQYDIPIIAPEGFMEEATSEAIFVGPIMRKRAVSMYGNTLPKGPKGQVGVGLGLATSRGTTSLIPPNDLIKTTSEERVIDGVKIIFQMVPETEAPAEINFYLPNHKALCISECATNNMHNIITLRGALVRDAKKWSKHLDETIDLFCHDAEVLFAGHHWPTWGREDIVKLISEQRDLYAYMHDQTVRMMNLGYNGTEIAEQMTLPPTLANAWHLQGFYGSLSHNVKAIYQRYMTWFDGNPANLWKHPPKEEAKRYVACMGGVDAVVGKAAGFVADGDLRFAATLLDHAVAAEPTHTEAKNSLADVYEKLGFGAENATWRNFYLTAAQRLRAAAGARKRDGSGQFKKLASINPGSTIEQWLDALSVELDGPRASRVDASGRSPSFTILLKVPSEDATHLVRLSNGTLSHRRQIQEQNTPGMNEAGLTLTVAKQDLYQLLAKARLDVVKTKYRGDFRVLETLLDLLNILQPAAAERATGKL
ncbi:hypothetical protein PRZ48_010098 [Zasmidium cellare]|uniref:Metallo-beta-lactamase domain-containing protein n=1 Tax=Zasmidium cellare TaxID=395010 RepID=A0ABR0EDL3_ZASCE|nr:hypothetical protein PRZ48_010098 [Zasmidium cellare]